MGVGIILFVVIVLVWYEIAMLVNYVLFTFLFKNLNFKLGTRFLDPTNKENANIGVTIAIQL
jgi:hypothetical protein